MSQYLEHPGKQTDKKEILWQDVTIWRTSREADRQERKTMTGCHNSQNLQRSWQTRKKDYDRMSQHGEHPGKQTDKKERLWQDVTIWRTSRETDRQERKTKTGCHNMENIQGNRQTRKKDYDRMSQHGEHCSVNGIFIIKTSAKLITTVPLDFQIQRVMKVSANYLLVLVLYC